MQACPNIARDLLDLWWSNAEHEARFNHVEIIFPAIVVSDALSLWQELVARTRSENARTRGLAAEVLGLIGHAMTVELVVQRLTECLRDSEWLVRMKSAEALGKLGSLAATHETLRWLTQCLHDPDGTVRTRAADALRQIQDVAPTEAIEEPDLSAKEALEWMEKMAAPQSLARLAECLRHRDKSVREQVLDGLSQRTVNCG
jgi:HEAT repeat protein